MMLKSEGISGVFIFLYITPQIAHTKIVKIMKGGKSMSPKELLYIEDALSQIKFMKEKCDAAQNEITDANLKKLIDKVSKKNQKMFDTIYALVATATKGGA